MSMTAILPTTISKKSIKDSLIPHAAFVVVAAALLCLQGCDSANAKPAAAAATGQTSAVKLTRPQVVADLQIDAGRYLIKLGGCNDCHTPGYVETIAMTGKAPAEDTWLTGADVGFSGPWGVSYPANLRLSFQNMTEEQFLEMAHEGKGRPPMPWPSLMAMRDEDLKAIYAYVHGLGASGKAVPAALPPGVEPDHPHIMFAPIMPKPAKPAAKKN